MPDARVDQMLYTLRALNISTGSIEGAVDQQRQSMDSFGMLTEDMAAVIDEAAELLRAELTDREILRRHSSYRRPEHWYNGPNQGSRHWPALKGYLQAASKRDEDTIRDMDETSSEIVSLLGNPGADNFSIRGLVLGYVQSGKTANMTAVIAKAVDAGYNMVIVLAGLTEKLRQQTERRLRADIVNRLPDSWRLYTSERDFEIPPEGRFPVHENVAHLIVLKKNTAERRESPGTYTGPLGKLKRTFEDTPQTNLRRLRVLVIDDECDQASVNSADGTFDVSTINACLRKTLALIPCVSYVGYTATPFANVLINPYPNDKATTNGQQLDDLYPEDFITSLPCPPAYFGAERLFGSEPVEADNPAIDERGLDVLRDVPPEDSIKLMSPSVKERESFFPEMCGALEDAILHFLASCSARDARGDAGEHMSMLIHTAAHVVLHERVAELVEDWVGQRRTQLLDPDSDISQRLKANYDREMMKVEGRFDHLEPVPSGDLHDHLPGVLKRLEFPIENGRSDDRVDYEKSGRCYIVTGGSILARGLTLEGLMVSFFLRGASQFDTLLQMGRWFGYRQGYEDLPRIWMPVDLQSGFQELAGVEAHIREDISRYSRNMTPRDLAVRIPVIPGMAITGAAKMKHAVRSNISYFGEIKQTTRFHHRDSAWLESNWTAASELLSSQAAINRNTQQDADRIVFRGVPLSAIRRFIRAFAPHSEQKDLDPQLILAFLDAAESKEELLLWNLAVFEPRSTKNLSALPLGFRPVRTVSRSRLTPASDTVAYIKALMSRADILYDLPDHGSINIENNDWSTYRAVRRSQLGNTPLLLLYAIDRNSEPRQTARKRGRNTERVALEASADMLGYAMVFPDDAGEGRGRRESGYVSVELKPPTADDLTAAEQQELEATSAVSSGE